MASLHSTQLNTWLPEPSQNDDSYARRGEHTLSWLARSTLPLAQEYRRFLNHNLAAVPLDAQAGMRHALWERWDSAFFELLVARVLQELGAHIVVERSNPDARQPDFTAQFADQIIIVEATSPVYNVSLSDEEMRRRPLLDFIEAHIPKGWLVLVFELPNLGPTDSKKLFCNTVTRILDIAPPAPEQGDLELSEDLPTGKLRLHLLPNASNSSRLGLEPPMVWWGDAEARIRKAIRQKRRQVRNSPAPVLLAIRASSLLGEAIDFDKALFGYTYSRVNSKGEIIGIGFRPDGEFNKPSDKPTSPTYAGVLAFLGGSCFGVPLPVLYRHPRSADQLPTALLHLEQRNYDPTANVIRSQAATIGDSALAGLKFISGID